MQNCLIYSNNKEKIKLPSLQDVNLETLHNAEKIGWIVLVETYKKKNHKL